MAAITEIIIRHGCPIDAQDGKGLTPKECFLKHYTPISIEHSTSLSTWLALLSTESLPRLQELTARTVLKWKIPYADILPAPLQKFLE